MNLRRKKDKPVEMEEEAPEPRKEFPKYPDDTDRMPGKRWTKPKAQEEPEAPTAQELADEVVEYTMHSGDPELYGEEFLLRYKLKVQRELGLDEK